MKPPPFRYERPSSLEEALSLRQEHGDEARPLAGGQSLVPMLNMRLARPAVLVDLNRIFALAGISTADGHLEVGSLVRQRELESCGVADPIGALSDALPLVGHIATRNRGTVGGSIAHADPAAELPLALLGLGGSVIVESVGRGRREIGADDLFTGFLTTALEPDELVVAVRFPDYQPGEASALVEVAPRHGDFALAAAACWVRLVDGHVAAARVAVGAVADRPLLVPEAADALIAGQPDDAGAAAAAAVEPTGSLHAPPEYQRHLIGVLVAAAARRAQARAAEPTRLGGRMFHQISPVQTVRRPDSTHIACTVNGRPVTADVDERRLLSDFLRHDVGLRGTHVGCEHGVCGACTIRLDGAAVRSCLMLAVQADGAEIETVEGLATPGDGGVPEEAGRLHPLQVAFRRHFALQCGFCTAGILMAAAELCDEVVAGAPVPAEGDIRALLSGHLCRCTGYEPIVAAIAEVVGAEYPRHAVLGTYFLGR
jgi:CO/xanthine dehydrogenase FAD-binding subunit/aerobic-type carbon monoxide dehydrogenase small subunit (CoxS/CutS family)